MTFSLNFRALSLYFGLFFFRKIYLWTNFVYKSLKFIHFSCPLSLLLCKNLFSNWICHAAKEEGVKIGQKLSLVFKVLRGEKWIQNKDVRKVYLSPKVRRLLRRDFQFPLGRSPEVCERPRTCWPRSNPDANTRSTPMASCNLENQCQMKCAKFG